MIYGMILYDTLIENKSISLLIIVVIFHVRTNLYKTYHYVTSSWYCCAGTYIKDTVFCPGFQKGRVPSEKGTFSAVNGPSKGHHYRGERKKKGTISAVNGTKKALLTR